MLFGMIVTIIGFLLLLDKMGIIANAVWSYFWPLLIIAIGLSIMYQRLAKQSDWCGYSDFDNQTQRTKSAKRTSAKK